MEGMYQVHCLADPTGLIGYNASDDKMIFSQYLAEKEPLLELLQHNQYNYVNVIQHTLPSQHTCEVRLLHLFQSFMSPHLVEGLCH